MFREPSGWDWGKEGGAEDCGRGGGWRKELQWVQAYGKADFFSPCSDRGRQMSACAASTLDCAALSTTTWPSLLSHRVWAAVTLWSFSPGQRKASLCCGSSTCMRVPQHLLHALLFFTQDTQKIGDLLHKRSKLVLYISSSIFRIVR